MNIVRSAVVGLALLMVTGVAVRAEDVEATDILILKQQKGAGACLKGGRGRLIGDKQLLSLFVTEFEGKMTCVKQTDYRSRFMASGKMLKPPVRYESELNGTLRFTVLDQAAETAK